MKRHMTAITVILAILLALAACAKNADGDVTPTPTESEAPLKTAKPSKSDKSSKSKNDDENEDADLGDADSEDTDSGNKGSGYAEEDYIYGKGRNTKGYTKTDAKNINYTNFLKLTAGMSIEKVKEILVTDTFEVSDSASGGVRGEFYSDERKLTNITVYFEDGKLKDAQFNDDYRLCIPSADISMDKFKQLDGHMTFDEIQAVLGNDFYIRRFVLNSGNDVDEYISWFNDEGEIRLLRYPDGKIWLLSQNGLSYTPDNRTAYPELTDKQVMDNFSKVKMGINYEQLEKQFNNYIPLRQTELNYGDTLDIYEFKRYGSEFISITFYFHDHRLYKKEFSQYPLDLIPKADIEKANKLKEGMNYDEVKDVIGVDGYKILETAKDDYTYDKFEEKYAWRLSNKNDSDYMTVEFTDGKIEDEWAIYIYVYEE